LFSFCCCWILSDFIGFYGPWDSEIQNNGSRPCPNSRVDIIVNEKILREKCLLDSSYWLEKFHIENFSLVTEHRTEQDTVYLNILPQIDVL
jgi:hypothetical protein